jgi:PHB/PHA accumulation regulator DNA-binding domain
MTLDGHSVGICLAAFRKGLWSFYSVVIRGMPLLARELYNCAKPWKGEPMAKLVKRYARSRLYDTQAARYVTLADLQEWQARGLAFTVIDVETGQDVTRILLA